MENIQLVRDLHNLVVSADWGRADDWPSQLTYYCSPQVAHSIFHHGELWQTDVRQMNDSSELNFAIETLRALAKNGSSYTTNSILRSLFQEAFEYWVGPQIQWQNTILSGDRLLVALCLSSRPNDLNMWRAYGRNGEGFAIHFSRPKIIQVSSLSAHQAPNVSRAEGGMIKVCYDAPTCMCFPNTLLDAEDAIASLESEYEYQLFQHLFYSEILRLIVSHKHPDFSSEDEFRLFQRHTTVKTWSGSDFVHHNTTDNGRSFLYSEIFLPHCAINESEETFWNSLISGVTAGPRASHSDVENVQAAMRARGITANIAKSSTPLRF